MTLKRKKYYSNPNHQSMKVTSMDFSVSKFNQNVLSLLQEWPPTKRKKK